MCTKWWNGITSGCECHSVPSFIQASIEGEPHSLTWRLGPSGVWVTAACLTMGCFFFFCRAMAWTIGHPGDSHISLVDTSSAFLTLKSHGHIETTFVSPFCFIVILMKSWVWFLHSSSWRWAMFGMVWNWISQSHTRVCSKVKKYNT